jgi:DnaB-like helicase N terminal domain
MPSPVSMVKKTEKTFFLYSYRSEKILSSSSFLANSTPLLKDFQVQLYNINIEKTILNSIIFELALFARPELQSLVVGDFFHPAHQNIFQAILALENYKQPIAEEFLKHRLEKKGVMKKHERI